MGSADRGFQQTPVVGNSLAHMNAENIDMLLGKCALDLKYVTVFVCVCMYLH